MLSDEMITKYQELFRKRFNRNISRQEALASGTRLLRLVDLIYKPMTEAEYQQLKKCRETDDL